MASAKVGIDCCGFLTVSRCCMPFSPYQFCSLINPVPFVVLSSAGGGGGVSEYSFKLQRYDTARTHKDRGT